jgi:undecaprenyl-diphosphatase
VDILHAVILGIIEGITEFLPVSSTGHLILASELLGIESTEFVKSFEIAIQAGAILAVVVLFWRKLLLNKHLFLITIISFLPTGILGLLFYKVVKTYLLGNSLVTVTSLLLGGLAIIVAERYFASQKEGKEIEKLTHKQALMIGLIQSVSMIPGVSRSAATIFGGLALGLNRKAAVEFSFLLAIPTMAAATGYDLLKTSHAYSSSELQALAIGCITAFITALIVVKWFIKFVQTSNLIPFGIYRIIAALAFFAFVYM